MALVPEGVTRVEQFGTNGSQAWQVIHHIDAPFTGTPTGTDANALASFMRGRWVDKFIPVQSDQVTHLGTIVTWSFGDGTFLDGESTTLVVGGDSGPTLDAAAAFLISWRVTATWRGGHPRSYIPGVVQDRLNDPATFTSATVTEVTTAAEEYRATTSSLSPPGSFHDLRLGCVRATSSGSPLDPQVFVPFVGAICRTVPGTQRRRLIG